jgi:hypothetical protein
VSKQTRIMYIEAKSGGLSGAARIGRGCPPLKRHRLHRYAPDSTVQPKPTRAMWKSPFATLSRRA